MSQERKHLGTILKNLPSLHNLEYKVVFNLPENIFFQKLVSKEVLEKVRIRPLDYFKALIFLDYFSRIIEEDFSVCANLENLSKAIRDKEREEEQKAGLSDKGEDGLSYLSLETAVYEAGLWAKEKELDLTKTKKKQLEVLIKQRYKQEPVIYSKSLIITSKSSDLRKIDPFYEGIGEMVCQQITDKMRKYISDISGRADLGALVFTDSIIGCLKDKSFAAHIYKSLESKDYLSASLVAFDSLISQASIDNLKSSLETKNA